MKNKQEVKILSIAVYQALQQDKKRQKTKKIVDNFLVYLRRHRLLFLIPDILKELETIHYNYQDILPVKIISRYKLDEILLQQLIKKIELKTNKQIKPLLANERQVIGGLKVRYADKLLDMTIAKQLKELNKQFIN